MGWCLLDMGTDAKRGKKEDGEMGRRVVRYPKVETS